MNILIVEDEKLSAEKLKSMIRDIIDDATIVGIAKSTDDAIALISAMEIDLGFFDIQIEDGLSFGIFEKTTIRFPVIFTTAFNDYAIRAFKLNSIDYLLKPVSKDELENAINKYKRIWNTGQSHLPVSMIEEVKKLITGSYKERFSVKIGSKFEILQVADICYFYSFEKGTYAKTTYNRDFLLDSSLENIYPLVNPKLFFRISRKYIVNINHIKNVYAYSNSRLRVHTSIDSKDELIVSREKVSSFKAWLEGN